MDFPEGYLGARARAGVLFFIRRDLQTAVKKSVQTHTHTLHARAHVDAIPPVVSLRRSSRLCESRQQHARVGGIIIPLGDVLDQVQHGRLGRTVSAEVLYQKERCSTKRNGRARRHRSNQGGEGAAATAPRHLHRAATAPRAPASFSSSPAKGVEEEEEDEELAEVVEVEEGQEEVEEEVEDEELAEEIGRAHV